MSNNIGGFLPYLINYIPLVSASLIKSCTCAQCSPKCIQCNEDICEYKNIQTSKENQ